MSNTSQHTEWLSMVEVSGPFLATSVLEKIFPQGLEVLNPYKFKRLRSAYEEWRDAIDESDPDLTELHRAWIELVLIELLEFDNTILFPIGQDEDYIYRPSDSTAHFAPDYLLRLDASDKPLLFISILPANADLEKSKVGDSWPAPLYERMVLLCRASGVRLGLITNGERWMLVNAPTGATSSLTSWYARLWVQEQVTLRAFQSLLGVRRWFGSERESLPAMLEDSLQYHEEVTNTLGEQVKRAVEVLVQSLDKTDQDRNRELLREVSPAELYEAGLTVMMRLVFILCAEERGLLLLGDPIYDQYYAITTLRGKLAEESDQYGHEVLERRHDAWSRLLAVFRAIYNGVEHETMRMPALGGSLFDPNRFPFLEGRDKGTSWLDNAAQPLPIDNRTVLLLLSALQLLEQKSGALALSYKALDVEQIGHVYEGLLENTVQRLTEDTLGFVGSQKAKNPNITLSELESASLTGDERLVSIIENATQRGQSSIMNSLKKGVDDHTFWRLVAACGGNIELAKRVRPFANLLRTDAWNDLILYRANSFAITIGADRRETGTHYTPKSLTESIVQSALEPIVYIGPADGIVRENWLLKSSAELLALKICDPAMGSGAFLVQACRWLSERLVEAWGKEASQGKIIMMNGHSLDETGGTEQMPNSIDEQLLIARRLVAEQCLYGVDLNPLAVELAKLSIWLITLAKGRPFGFLDHNLRSGDSLLGLHKIEQLTQLSLHPEKKQTISIFTSNIEDVVQDVLILRNKLRETPIRDIRDVQYMERLDQQAKQKLENLEHIADIIVGEVLATGGNTRKYDAAMHNLSTWATAYIEGDIEVGSKIISEAIKKLSTDLPIDKPHHKPFHWVLEFPEVFTRGGFDGIVGNPPFMRGKNISGYLGHAYREYLTNFVANGIRGSTDLVGYFFLRAYSLINGSGVLGMLTVNTLTQGDSRKVVVDQLYSQGCKIINANKDITWPGAAAVAVHSLIFYKREWNGITKMNEKVVSQINPDLSTSVFEWSPVQLKSIDKKAFQGVVVLGDGFILTNEEKANILAQNPNCKDLIFPYYNTKEIYSTPALIPKRYIISMWDWTEEEAKTYSPIYEILEKKVKPFRQERKANGEYKQRNPLPIRWWQYADKRPALFHEVGMGEHFNKHPEHWAEDRKLNFVLARSITGKHHVIAILPLNIIYDQTYVIFAYDEFKYFSLLQSSIHHVWAIERGSTLGTSPRYNPMECFFTFVKPNHSNLTLAKLEEIGLEYYNCRERIKTKKKIGLTQIYNLFHNQRETSTDIEELRVLQMKIDNAVIAAYEWNDLELDHGFHKTSNGVYFTIAEVVRREVLQRLLKLNQKYYQEEVEQGLLKNRKKISSKKSKATKNDSSTKSLFD